MSTVDDAIKGMDMLQVISALRAENERLRRLLLIARPWIVAIVDRENAIERRVVLQEINDALWGDIRAALPIETGMPLEKHGISEE